MSTCETGISLVGAEPGSGGCLDALSCRFFIRGEPPNKNAALLDGKPVRRASLRPPDPPLRSDPNRAVGEDVSLDGLLSVRLGQDSGTPLLKLLCVWVACVYGHALLFETLRERISVHDG